ncbi:MAG TPA: hypothetical protein VHN14_30705 [Kofleriaceae bacterium]|nr:hypothetical protein [Kofleriaceae bacterium]
MGPAVLRLFLPVALLVGCGKVSDSPPADAAADSVDADLGGDATIVTEAALFGGKIGTKVGNIDIISTFPDATVLAMAKTDASGAATIRVYPGGAVTAVYRHTVDMGADLITWVGVKPGDTLTFGSRQFSTAGQTNTSLGTQTLSWPALAGITEFEVFTSCTGLGAGTALSIVGTESSLCHQEPMDVLYGAFNGNTLTSFGFRSNVTFTNGGTVALGGWSPVQTGSINVTGLPAEITLLSGSFATILDANRQLSLVGGYSGTPTGGAFSTTFTWHPTGERTVGSVSLARTGFSSMHILDSFSASTLTQTVAAPALTPWVQGSVTSSSALRMASWFVIPDTASVHDGQLLRVSWNRVISGTGHPHQWHFILPPGQTSISYPALPSQFSDIMPVPEASTSATIRLFDISSATGYDMVRAMPSRNIMCLDCAVNAGEIQRVVFTP